MEAPRKFVVKRVPYVYKSQIAAEMDALMREWYANLGQMISPEELKICREVDYAEIVEAERIEAAALAARKPVYGTPEFWKVHWEKKRGTGCPPNNEGARGTGCPPKGAKAKQTTASPKCAK